MRNLIRRMASTAVMILLLSTVGASAATATPNNAGTPAVEHVAGQADNVYYLVNYHSGKCLTVHGQATGNGAVVDQFRCVTGAQNQWWVVTSVGALLWRITGYQSGKSLTVAGQGTANGAKVVIWDWVGSETQLFNVNWLGATYAPIHSYHSGKCLDVQGASQADNAPVIQWSCNGGHNQAWRRNG